MESREIHAIIMRIPPCRSGWIQIEWGKANVHKKYDADFKIQLVKEYLEKKKENPKLAKSDLAFEHKVSDSTFNVWVLKYQKIGDEFANVTNQIQLLSCNVVEAPVIVKYVEEVLMLM